MYAPSQGGFDAMMHVKRLDISALERAADGIAPAG